MKWRDKGLSIPDTIDPGDATCLRCYVPNDPLYIAAFWTAVEYLCSWRAWEKDAAHRGKLVAAVWKPWFEKSRLQWELGRRCDELDVRQNPDNPCILEKRMDDDEWEWIPFADLRKCKIPVEPPQYEDEGAAEIADILWWMKSLLERVDELLTAGNPQGVVIVAGEQITALGEWAFPISKSLFGAMGEHTEQERQDALDSIDWEDWHTDNYCKLRDVVSYQDDHVGWLDGLSNAIFAWLESASGWIFDTLNDLASRIDGDGTPIWLRGGISIEGGGAGFGFTPTCPGDEWEVVLHFDPANGYPEGQPWGFTPVYIGGLPQAAWDGYGWRAIQAGYQRYRVLIQSPVWDTFELRSVTFHSSMKPSQAQYCRMPTWDDYSIYNGLVAPPASTTVQFVPMVESPSMMIGHTNVLYDPYTGYLEWVTIVGAGPNPWE